MKEKIPSKEDIYYYGMLEEEDAIKHFYGKNVEEASKLFFLNPEYYGEDLFWMGVEAYFYYINSIKEYLLSEEGKENFIFIDYVLWILEFRLDNEENFRSAFKNHKKSVLEILTIIEEITKKKTSMLSMLVVPICQIKFRNL